MISTSALLAWISRHAYGGLFLLLAVGVVGVPVPDEVLMTFAGALAYSGRVHLLTIMAVAAGGAVCGITVSWALGRLLGRRAVERLGRRIGVTDTDLDRVRRWFGRWGRWTLLFGYFVPGVRHLTALVAGTSSLRWRRFAPFAYTGAVVWSQAMVLLGYRFGRDAEGFARSLHGHLAVAGAAAAVGLAVWLAWRVHRSRRH